MWSAMPITLRHGSFPHAYRDCQELSKISPQVYDSYLSKSRQFSIKTSPSSIAFRYHQHRLNYSYSSPPSPISHARPRSRGAGQSPTPLAQINRHTFPADSGWQKLTQVKPPILLFLFSGRLIALRLTYPPVSPVTQTPEPGAPITSRPKEDSIQVIM